MFSLYSITPRRIDLLLANRALIVTIEGYTLDWDTGIPSHASSSSSCPGLPPSLSRLAISVPSASPGPPYPPGGSLAYGSRRALGADSGPRLGQPGPRCMAHVVALH
jgi:hypothetical protein